ncbi:MAG TPA: hypothetical protein PLP04_14740, partial [Bryobacteraceae bacterium]|nr:hypothetical protein [Bryobacteraceae bacterium]
MAHAGEKLALCRVGHRGPGGHLVGPDRGPFENGVDRFQFGCHLLGALLGPAKFFGPPVMVRGVAHDRDGVPLSAHLRRRRGDLNLRLG